VLVAASSPDGGVRCGSAGSYAVGMTTTDAPATAAVRQETVVIRPANAAIWSQVFGRLLAMFVPMIAVLALLTRPDRLAAFLIVAAALGHLAYLVRDCPIDLSGDEAHYWDWSRHLDWSYYSKGPLVAYIIRASCAVFGDVMWAVRLPAVLCNALLLAAVYRLAAGAFGNRVGLAAASAELTVPPLAALWLKKRVERT